MIVKKYNQIMEQEESYRQKWATGLAVSFSLVIFVGFAFYKGYLGFENSKSVVQKPTLELASVVSAEKAPSPIDGSKQNLKSLLYEIDNQYQSFKDSLANVLVPFITGIEVYERE
jgi:hypothetical protein